MFDRLTRPIKEKLLLPFALFVGNFFSPNQISLAGFIAGIISSVLIIQGSIMLGLVFWGLNRILDGLDGTVARIRDKQSDFGGYLDLILDLILYTAIPAAFVYYGIKNNLYNSTSLMWSCLILFAIFYINLGSWSILSALIEKRNNTKLKQREKDNLTSLVMPQGLIEGTETVIFYTLFFILPKHLILLFYAMSFLVFIGAIQRFIWAGRNIR